MQTENQLFICESDDLSHQLIAEIFDAGNDKSIDPEKRVQLVFSISLQKSNFFKRLWRAAGYVFGRQQPFSSITFQYDDTERLIKMLVNYRKKYKERILVDAVQSDAVRVPLDKIPAYYGYKFLFADVRAPLAAVYYAVNGELAEMGLRVDLAKAVFLDQITDTTLMRAVNQARSEIFKIILDGTQKE